jgi:hypothetical protein
MIFNQKTNFILLSSVLVFAACGKNLNSSQLSNTGSSAGIIGGQDVVAGDELATSTVALYDFEKGALCTGTLLSDSILLTAAHCVVDSKASTLVLMFGTDLQSSQETRKVQRFLTTKTYGTYLQQVDTIQNDPELIKKSEEMKKLIADDVKIQAVIDEINALADAEPDLTMEDPRVVAALEKIETLKEENAAIKAKGLEIKAIIDVIMAKLETLKDIGDVAIVKFSGGLPAGYKPAKLMRNKSDLVNGMDVVLAGYGISDGIAKSGAGVLRKTQLKLSDANYSNTEVRFDQRSGTGACHGDSGGPAFAKVRGETLVFGVTSRGSEDKDDTCGVFAIYTSIPGEIAFVDQAIAELNKPTPNPIDFFKELGKALKIPQLSPNKLRPN